MSDTMGSEDMTSPAERHVVVPVEPTEEMLRAGQVAVDEPAAPLVGLRRLGNAYRAMLSAAPPVSDSDRLRALYQQRADINYAIAELERKLSPEPQA